MATAQRPFARLRLVITGWPRLFIALAIAAVMLVVCLLAGFSPTTTLLIAWDIGVIAFLGMVAEMIVSSGTDEIRSRAARQDVGQFVILALTAIAALASVGAIYAELGLGSSDGNDGIRLALALLTIVLSWFFVHLIFAVHYAHEYYGPSSGMPKGLDFPGGEAEPDYWDFIYFALVIGMTAQVADVAVTNRLMRRTVLAHGVIAFFFNVALLALVVNVAADAIRP
jgi:uncharacterized membrane protein